MSSRQRLLLSAMLSGGPLLGLCGCGQEASSAPRTVRAVNVMVLKQTGPGRDNKLRLTGSVESWKEEEIGFEVAGRVEAFVDVGQDVEGPPCVMRAVFAIFVETFGVKVAEEARDGPCWLFYRFFPRSLRGGTRHCARCLLASTIGTSQNVSAAMPLLPSRKGLFIFHDTPSR